MREVAIIAYAQTPLVRDCGAKNDVELVMEVVNAVKKQVGFTNQDLDFFCSGSCDYLGGSAFAFVNALDALGAVPPINESHVEMDAAWALYEAWLKIQTATLAGQHQPCRAASPRAARCRQDQRSRHGARRAEQPPQCQEQTRHAAKG